MNTLTLRPLAGPVHIEVAIPGSKSYTIRALLLAALVDGPVRLLNPLISDDTTAMLACLNALGVRTESDENFITVLGSVQDIQLGQYELNADLSAASIRFLIALSCIIPGEQVLYGREGLNKRPVRELVESLCRMGAEIDYVESDGYPPVRVRSSTLKPGAVTIDGSISSQYISAILMIAPLLSDVTLEITGEPVSKPYIDMTLSIMRQFGVSVSNENYRRFTIAGAQRYQAEEYAIEADASSAAYFAAMAALTQSTVMLNNLNPDSAQADMRFLQILVQMGNGIDTKDGRITVQGRGVQPIDVDMEDCPDQAQTLAVLAAFADGVTRITGVQSLRIKETNRLEAVACELGKMGIRTVVEEDTLTIFGGNPQPAAIDTYGDHRMAMAFAVAGAKLPELRINDPQVVSKTFPTFWEEWRKAGVETQLQKSPSLENSSRKIVLIGFMGSGKSVIAPRLAQALNLDVVEMDQEVVRKSGRANIPEIFDQDGEAHFRDLEMQVAEELRSTSNVVISAGGGIVMNPQAMAALSENSLLIWLDTALETVLSRIGLNNGRPLLKNRKEAEELYTLRAPLYRQYAEISVTTDRKNKTQIVDEILSALGRKGTS